MPVWLISMIISLAFKLGMTWLMHRFPKLQERFPLLWEILQSLMKKVDSGELTRAEAEKEAHARIKTECFGVGCPIDTKGD